MTTYGSTFTGIGGFDAGFDAAGLQCLWQVEKDSDCQKILKKHWPKTRRGTLIEDIDESYPAPDVLCGGFPCQDLSVAGRRKGLAGKRSGLYYEFLRLVRLFAPGTIVLENVPGLYSSWSPTTSSRGSAVTAGDNQKRYLQHSAVPTLARPATCDPV